ncbi:MAG: GNAT family N-acetyltransferase [Mangrovicoccus sp.]
MGLGADCRIGVIFQCYYKIHAGMTGSDLEANVMDADSLEIILTGKDGEPYRVRPIRLEDAPSLIRGYDAMSERGKWFRMLHAVPHLTEEMAHDFCSPNMMDEVCLVVEGHDEMEGEIMGGARVAGMGAGKRAEFSVSLRPEARGLGLAKAVLKAAVDIAEHRGCRGVWGCIARQNDAMLGLARSLGMTTGIDPDDPALRMAVLEF